MTTMRRFAIGILLASVLSACGGGGLGVDGGQSGTGIASIVGNVVAPVGTSISGIRVRVDSTSLESTTDDAGNFSLGGDLGGNVELIFERDEDMIFATLGVAVPKGGVLSLADVFVEPQSAQADPALREVEFEGLVHTLDCAGQILLVSSRSDPDGALFEVDLAAATIRDEQERPITCEGLMVGDVVEVESEVEEDGLLVKTEITLKGGEDDDKATMEDDGEDDGGEGDGEDDGEEDGEEDDGEEDGEDDGGEDDGEDDGGEGDGEDDGEEDDGEEDE